MISVKEQNNVMENVTTQQEETNTDDLRQFLVHVSLEKKKKLHSIPVGSDNDAWMKKSAKLKLRTRKSNKYPIAKHVQQAARKAKKCNKTFNISKATSLHGWHSTCDFAITNFFL